MKRTHQNLFRLDRSAQREAIDGLRTRLMGFLYFAFVAQLADVRLGVEFDVVLRRPFRAALVKVPSVLAAAFSIFRRIFSEFRDAVHRTALGGDSRSGAAVGAWSRYRHGSNLVHRKIAADELPPAP